MAAAGAAASEQKTQTVPFVDSSTGAKVAKNVILLNPSQLAVKRKSVLMPAVILRGDMGKLTIGEHCTIGENCVLRPPTIQTATQQVTREQTIGDYTVIGKDCVIEAASIGTCVRIGDGCVIGKRCTIGDYREILPGSVLPAEASAASFCQYGGVPAAIVAELPDHVVDTFKDAAAGMFAALTKPTPT